MFQGMCTEVRVLHKKKAKGGGEKREEKKRLRVSESTQLFFFFSTQIQTNTRHLSININTCKL